MEKEAASQRAGARGRVARSVGWALIIQIVSAAGRMSVDMNHPGVPNEYCSQMGAIRIVSPAGIGEQPRHATQGC